MMKHKLFVSLITIFLIALIILTVKLPETVQDNICTCDSDCSNNSKCINGTCESLIGTICREKPEFNYKNIYEQTYVELIYQYPSQNFSIEKKDVCMDNQTVLEWFCENNSLRNKTFICENNCSEGKCTLDSVIEDTTPINNRNYVSLEQYNLKGLAINIDDIIHDNNSGYNYVYLTLINISNAYKFGTKRVRVGSFAVFKVNNEFIRVSAPSIYVSANSTNSAVQLKIDVGKEFEQYYAEEEEEKKKV